MGQWAEPREEHEVGPFCCRVAVAITVNCDVPIDVLLEHVVARQSSPLVLGWLSQGPVRSIGIRDTGKHEEARVHDLSPTPQGG